MSGRKTLLGVTVLSSILLLAACGNKSASGPKKQTIRMMQGDVIQTMDPALATDVISGQVMQDTYAGLYRYSGKKLQPDMATKMATVSKDQLTYTFHIRNNQKWSDGKQLTAKDFEYGWKRAVDPATKSEYAYVYSGIKNADAIMAGKAKPSTLGIKATSKYGLKVTLEKPIPYFNSLITLQCFDPVEKSQVDKYGKKYGTNSNTLTFNGPYTLGKWNGANNSWTETKNPKYWNAKNVHVQTLKTQVVKENTTALNLYQDNKLDDVVLTGNSASQNQNDPAYHIVPQSATYYLEPNNAQVPEFKNVKIRQALSLAVNRKEFIRKVLGNGSQPVHSVVAAKMFYNEKTGQDYADALGKKSDSYSDYNLSKAKTLFKQGMDELGEKHFTFTLTGDDTEAAKATQEYLQSALQKVSSGDVSVTVKTHSVPFKTRVALAHAHNFQMLITAWAADYPDAITFLDMFRSDNESNDAKWSNPQFDAYIHAASGKDVADPQKRWDDLVKAGRVMTENVGVIPLYQNGASHLTRTSIKGMKISPASMINFVGATNKTSK
ncbi:peptide ABC transporter substrate-binding protein [Lacticaseibacillus zhaodongensis]|uniref:peptide ABC transporter substrate-binding protein n=1 Tax=Lacticaseibacillus zhaodongensis TaxID=2668065 RepID=UPI0012D32D6D|nr:peptide ABC transporter substrate-binding protein [Lacticaseibacillus zhaodongensis]